MNEGILFKEANKSFLKTWVFLTRGGTWLAITVVELHEENLHLIMEQMEGDTFDNIIKHIEKQYGKNYAISIVVNKHEKERSDSDPYGIWAKSKKFFDLKEEAGITEHSLHNMEVVLAWRGMPSALHFKADVKKCNYVVIAEWGIPTPGHYNKNQTFEFTGFAWGYAGEGSRGLNTFLARVGVTKINADRLPIDKFGKTDCGYYIEEGEKS